MSMVFDPGNGDMIVIDGNIVEKDALRIAEKINDYDDRLFLICLDPSHDESAVTDAPFVVVRQRDDGLMERVLEAWALDDRIMERIWLSDNQKNDQLKLIADRELAIKNEKERIKKEKDAENAAKFLAALKNPTSSYTLHNHDGELVTINEQGPVTRERGKKELLMNVLEVIRKAGRRFGDSSSVIIVEQDFLDFINDAQLTIARETNCFTGTVAPAANTFPWVIAGDVIEINRVLYENLPIPKIEIESLDALGIDVTNYDGGPTYFYINNNMIHLYPSALITDTTVVNIEYSKIPVVITTTADALTVPTVNHEDIVTFVLMRCHEVNQNYRAQEIAMGEFMSKVGNRLDNATVKDDTYSVIRDDPNDFFWGWDYAR